MADATSTTTTTTTTPESTTTTAPTTGADLNPGNMAILARLKELEAANQHMERAMEGMRSEASAKEEKIKALSADKRKDMEQMIETAIDTWLNSLTGVSEDVRKQFRSGISRIAEQADIKNSAWEVVCQASALHTSNVAKIEELIKTCNEQTKTIESLVGNNNNNKSSTFAVPAARISAVPVPSSSAIHEPPEVGHKRPREDDNNVKHTEAGGDAWDLFSSMMRENSRAVYF